MKANKAPERIWMDLEWIPHFDCKDCITEDSVEYIRTDAFIEKACEFLKSYRQDTKDGMGYIPGIVNDKTIEDFKTYMKGE